MHTWHGKALFAALQSERFWCTIDGTLRQAVPAWPVGRQQDVKQPEWWLPLVHGLYSLALASGLVELACRTQIKCHAEDDKDLNVTTKFVSGPQLIVHYCGLQDTAGAVPFVPGTPGGSPLRRNYPAGSGPSPALGFASRATDGQAVGSTPTHQHRGDDSAKAGPSQGTSSLNKVNKLLCVGIG